MNADQHLCSSAILCGLNPLLTVFKDFFFPDWHSSLELLDGPFAGLKGSFAMWRARGNDHACFTNVQTSGAMHNPKVRNLKLLVSFNSQTLHFSQRHRLVSFIDEV